MPIARGVAAGVVEVFRRVLEGSQVAPEDVVFLAHSTTQATNALLEGDVAPVGIVAIASGPAAELAAKQSRVEGIELAPGRVLHPFHRFLHGEALDPAAAAQAVNALREEGARVIVATSAFGVDDGSDEELVRDAAAAIGLPVTCGHEISKLYGLATRTRTAVINASILPRMIETADMTEASVREAGIVAPLMIMRGDGGVMEVHEMRRRPAMTMLSGPAASVAGALMHLRISDGIYFEVGGTSTNIGVIRNGRPTVKYAKVGGHETYVSSLDVRVLGIAGGSLVRASDGGIADVGPRSAHIAGLAYSAFASSDTFEGATLELFQPGPGEAADHVAIRGRDGQRYAITTTCAANALGYAKSGMYAFGNPQAARAALQPLAALLGVPADEAARQILQRRHRQGDSGGRAADRRVRARPRPGLLVGEGGGAGGADAVRRRAAGPAARDLARRRGDLLDRRGARPGARGGRARDRRSGAGGTARHPPRSARRRGPARRRGRDGRGHDRDRPAQPAGARHRGRRLRDAGAPSPAYRRGRRPRGRRRIDGRAGRRGAPRRRDRRHAGDSGQRRRPPAAARGRSRRRDPHPARQRPGRARPRLGRAGSPQGALERRVP
jgi:hypothetical protein